MPGPHSMSVPKCHDSRFLLGPPGLAHGLVSGSARPAGLLPPSCYVLAASNCAQFSAAHSESQCQFRSLATFDHAKRGVPPPPPPPLIQVGPPSGSATVDVTLNPPCLQMTGRQLNASTNLKASGRPAGSEHSVHAYSSTFPSIVVLNRTILFAHPRLVRTH